VTLSQDLARVVATATLGFDGNEDKGTPVDIKEEDIVSSIHEALQFVSYYHPRDLIQHLSAALRHWSPFDEEITPTRSQNFALNISKI